MAEADLNIPETSYTFGILTDRARGIIRIWGNSTPDSAVAEYAVFSQWLNAYFKNPAHETHVDMHFGYYNNTTSLMLLDFIRRFEQQFKTGLHIEVTWHYNPGDEDMMENGEDFRNIVNFPFNLVKDVSG